MLHGVGVESPTQIAIFVASTSASGRPAGFMLLGAWVVGLVIANGGLAFVASRGAFDRARSGVLHRLLAVATAIGSIGLGSWYLLG